MPQSINVFSYRIIQESITTTVGRVAILPKDLSESSPVRKKNKKQKTTDDPCSGLSIN